MVLSGKSSPELPTDQQCDHCGRFFCASGIESHQENCEVKESEMCVTHSGKLVMGQCEDCGVWATTSGTEHREDCYLNQKSPDMLGGAVTTLSPTRLPELSAEDF